ncbi:DUF1360 domain-containing protein [Alteribacter keqinensis]|uniref:DUF1360 domain-containing protein n=1 Tax=Alteribacter keqinensis TaxID=2483800 RepID=A0A3M7TW21_9BACI|nr:DUF1360 domain-containing protein [Alteribacter keqinensis]RNA69870.1 DUF1360 domain-containing protein [Alteribacter keqinensis]
MEVTWLGLVLLSLAAFRLTHLVVYDRIMLRFRLLFLEVTEEEGEEYYVPKAGRVNRVIGELITCHWCTSVWASAVLVGGYYYLPTISSFVIILLAVAGVAALIEAVTVRFLLDE